MVDREAAAAEAIRRGLITPQQAQQMGFGRASQQAHTGQLAPGGPVAHDTKADQEALAQYRAMAEKSLYAAQQAQEFMRINQREATGGINGVGFPWPGGGTVGDLRAMHNDDLAQMKSISSRVAPQNRVVGSGSSSDRDVTMQVEGFPNINAPGPSNQATARQWQAKSDQDAALAAFMDAWYARNGTLLGAQQAFTNFWARRKAGDQAANNAPTSEGWTDLGNGTRIRRKQ